MADPLSIASSVAGLVATAGTVSKLFYQFFQSIHDASSTARDLARTLYTLNLALSQIQETLLDPDFVSVADDKQLEAIQESLASCTATFGTVEARVSGSGLTTTNQELIRKAWSSVQAWFTETKCASAWTGSSEKSLHCK